MAREETSIPTLIHNASILPAFFLATTSLPDSLRLPFSLLLFFRSPVLLMCMDLDAMHAVGE